MDWLTVWLIGWPTNWLVSMAVPWMTVSLEGPWVTVSLAGFGGNVNLDLIPNLYQLWGFNHMTSNPLICTRAFSGHLFLKLHCSFCRLVWLLIGTIFFGLFKFFLLFFSSSECLGCVVTLRGSWITISSRSLEIWSSHWRSLRPHCNHIGSEMGVRVIDLFIVPQPWWESMSTIIMIQEQLNYGRNGPGTVRSTVLGLLA